MPTCAWLPQTLKTRDLPSWINFPDFERVDWLNALLGRLWPHVTAAATTLVHEQLDPQLKANKPRWIADISLDGCAPLTHARRGTCMCMHLLNHRWASI